MGRRLSSSLCSAHVVIITGVETADVGVRLSIALVGEGGVALEIEVDTIRREGEEEEV